MPSSTDLFDQYQELQRYVGWTDEDGRRVAAVATMLEPSMTPLIDDFYDEIRRHPDAHKVITGGEAQIQRLKGTLVQWLRQLLSGRYDREYVERRWRVGWRHVQIGLDQVYTNAALSRLRGGLTRAIHETWKGSTDDLMLTLRAMDKLLDLDLAIIESAYQAEYLARQRQLDRLATIGQMAGGVAHELRQPLNVIQTSIYYLRHARTPSPEKTAEHLERIENQVVRADNVITALSRFTRLTAPQTEPLLLPALIQAVREIEPPPEGVHFVLDCAEGVPAVAADRQQMLIVLGNLLRNAYDAMQGEGTLTVSCMAADGSVQIAVCDSGSGIPEEQLHRIMEPLYTTKAQGIGLGLAIARTIVEKHAGQLTVTSKPGAGTTFTVTLPAAGSAAPSSSDHEHEQQQITDSGRG